MATMLHFSCGKSCPFLIQISSCRLSNIKDCYLLKRRLQAGLLPKRALFPYSKRYKSGMFAANAFRANNSLGKRSFLNGSIRLHNTIGNTIALWQIRACYRASSIIVRENCDARKMAEIRFGLHDNSCI